MSLCRPIANPWFITRALSSLTIAEYMKSAPEPPCSSGSHGQRYPWPPAFSQIERGTMPSRSHSWW